MKKTFLKTVLGMALFAPLLAQADIHVQVPSSETTIVIIGNYGGYYDDTTGNARVSFYRNAGGICYVEVYSKQFIRISVQQEKGNNCDAIEAALESATASAPIKVTLNPRSMKITDIGQGN